MSSRKTQPALDLVGGTGTKPQAAEKPAAARVVFDPTPEHIAEMSDESLWDAYGAMREYDASGGRVTRKLRREIDRRGL